MIGGSKFSWLFLLVSLILGLYMVNVPLGIFNVPGALVSIEPWIVLIGGLLVVFGGISYKRIPRY